MLSYVVSILQDLADMSDEESFDVDAFCETIVAYMPVTEVIPAEEITDWMFALAKEQREKNARKNKHQIDLKSVIEETTKKGQRKISESSSIDMNLESDKKPSRISESSDNSNPDCLEHEQVDQLMEMFPSVCAVEVTHCLNLTSGDIERAAQFNFNCAHAWKHFHQLIYLLMFTFMFLVRFQVCKILISCVINFQMIG